jgi:hypothetical protein
MSGEIIFSGNCQTFHRALRNRPFGQVRPIASLERRGEKQHQSSIA